MLQMKYHLAPDFRKPILDMERYKFMIGLCIFEKRIQEHEDCEELSSLTFDIISDDGTIYKKLAKSPSLSIPKEKKIVINLSYCLDHQLFSYYPAIIAIEIGHIFPLYSVHPPRLQAKIKDPDAKFNLLGIPPFECDHGPYSNYAADFYACRWGFLKEIISYRFRITGDPDYQSVLEKYKDETAFRIAAYRHHKTTKSPL